MSMVRLGTPILIAALIFGALIWSLTASTMPRADFAFYNGEDVKTVDPARASGQPEGRVIWAIFEGLLRPAPSGEAELEIMDDENLVKMNRYADGSLKIAIAKSGKEDSAETFEAESESQLEERYPKAFEIYSKYRDSHAWLYAYTPEPAVAKEMPTVSEDGRTYTFKIRQGAKWSNGRQITSEDFAWSWMRQLHPETTGEYKFQLFYIEGAAKFSNAEVEVGDPVEVELCDGDILRKSRWQTFPQATVVRGELKEIVKGDEPKKGIDSEGIKFNELEENFDERKAEWRRNWTFIVEVDGEERAFSKADAKAYAAETDDFDEDEIELCYFVLPDWDKTVGVKTPDDETLVVTLKDPAAYFNDLVAFYTLSPVCRECVEEYGTPAWTRPENIVTNGAYTVTYRGIRDRIRMEKSETYWDKDSVTLEVVDSISVKNAQTAFNLYMDDQLDWSTDVPATILEDLKKRDDFHVAPMLTSYFYRINVEREGLQDKRVRQALNMAINKELIVERVTQAGEIPARTYVPPGLPPYESPKCGAYDPDRARELLKEAGFPGGAGFPKIEILYNTSDNHRDIAEVIQQQWKNELGISVELRNLEWGTYLDTVQQVDFTVARAGWIGDYPDPNTFLDMFVTDGTQNNTNWSNKRYDELIEGAAKELDLDKRREMLQEAEAILMDELPIIPIYYSVSKNLVKPYVRGFKANLQDIHPIRLIRIEKEE